MTTADNLSLMLDQYGRHEQRFRETRNASLIGPMGTLQHNIRREYDRRGIRNTLDDLFLKWRNENRQ